MAGLLAGLASAGGLIPEFYKLFYGERAWKRMAPSTKQQLDYEDAINDENAAVAYVRQREFQQDYLTPESQLKSQAAGYSAIGMNKMLLAGSQPGASSASSPQADSASGASPDLPGGLGSFFSSLLNYKVEKERVDNEYKLRERGLDIERDRVEAMKGYYGSLIPYYNARTTGVNNENSIFTLRKEDLEQSVGLKKDSRAQITQWIEESASRVVVNGEQASYLFSQATKTDIEAAGQALQNQILAAQEKYSDKYFEAVARLTQAQANIATFESSAVKRYWDKKMLVYEKELEGMIVSGQQVKDWVDSDAWKAICAGKMTTAERAQFWGNLVGGVLRTGISAAAGVAGASIMKGLWKPGTTSVASFAIPQPGSPPIPFN